MASTSATTTRSSTEWTCFHEASGGKYLPPVVFFDLEPGMIDAARASLLGELFRL
jgi:hypothetical protein